MKLPKEVKILIHPDGRVEIETYGFRGESCLDISKTLAKALVGENASPDDIQEELQPEYYQQDLEVSNELEQREK